MRQNKKTSTPRTLQLARAHLSSLACFLHASLPLEPTSLATLSHRLIKLEQRLAAMELQLQNQMAPHPQELEALQSVDSLLADCRELLATSAPEMDQAA